MIRKMSIMPTSNKGNNFVQIFTIFAMSLGGFTSGATMAWPSPTIPHLTANTSYIGQITIEEASYFAIITPLSMSACSIFVGMVMSSLGRRYTLGLMTIPHVVSWILIATAKSIVSIYVARAICGISDAITYTLLAVYIGEVATARVRGNWGNMVMCGILLGNLSVGVIGAFCDIVTTAYILLCVPILQAICAIFIPESPYFLLSKGRNEKAKAALKRLRWMENVDEEFATLVKDAQRQRAESRTIRDLFCIRSNRRSLMILLILRSCQQFSGLSAFTIYVQYIFALAGLKSLPPALSSIIFYVVLFSVSVFASIVFSNFGRRIMLVLSSLGCTIFLLVDSIYFYILDETDIDVSQITWIPLLGLVCYITSLSSGLSLIPTLMMGELFSSSIKNIGAPFVTAYLGLTMVLVPKILQVLLTNFSMYIPFLFFTCACLASTIFCYIFVPETKGKTLVEIQNLLNRRISFA